MTGKEIFLTKESLDHILVFKTNISTAEDKAAAGAVMDGNVFIQDWSIDTEDCDCVLRVVSYFLTNEDIIKLIKQEGFECAELE